VIGGTVSGIAAQLTIDGGADIDVLTVDDTGSAQDKTGALTASSLTGFGMTGAIGYSALESLGVFLGSGNDTVSVTSTMHRDGFKTVTELATGAGNDTVTVALKAGIDGFFALNTEAGDDVVHAATSTLSLVIFGGEG